MPKESKNKINQTIGERGEQFLDDILKQLKPKARYVAETQVDEYTDSIYKEIINGDIDVSTQRLQIPKSPEKYDIERNIRKKFMSKVEKQKQELEQKLGYVTNSINSMKKYDRLKAALRSPQSLRASFTGSDSRSRDQEWKQQIARRTQQIEARKKLIEEQRKRKQEEMRESMKKLEQQKKQQKKKLILEHMKAIESRMKQRQIDYRQANERYEKVKREKSMHERLEQSYQEKQKSLLDERKKKLAEIRNFHKPIDEEDIRQHESRFLQLKKQKQEIRERQRKMNESRTQTYKPSYEGVFYKQIIENQNQEVDDPATIKTEKMRQFSEHVRSHFTPTIDEEKRLELEELIEKQRNKEIEHEQKERQLLKMSKMKGIEYLHSLRNLPKKQNNRNKANLTNLESPKTDRIQYKNYLTHHSTADKGLHKKKWSKILDSSQDKQSKALKIQFESQRLQEELKRRQKQVKLLKKDDSVEIDQQYFDMIKAKLNLLQ